MRTTITLGDMQAKGITMLVVACDKCGRRGRLRVSRLIAEFGRDDGGHLAKLIAADCPGMKNPSPSIYGRCGIHFPELPKWF